MLESGVWVSSEVLVGLTGVVILLCGMVFGFDRESSVVWISSSTGVVLAQFCQWALQDQEVDSVDVFRGDDSDKGSSSKGGRQFGLELSSSVFV